MHCLVALIALWIGATNTLNAQDLAGLDQTPTFQSTLLTHTLVLKPHRTGLKVTLPHIPMAIAVYEQKLWMAFPEGTALQTTGDFPKSLKGIQKVPAVGGSLYCIALPPHFFPFFAAKNPRQLIIGPQYQKAKLPTRFHDGSLFYKADANQVGLAKRFHALVSTRKTLNGKILHFYLDDLVAPGFGPCLETASWSALPTIKGFVALTDPDQTWAELGGIYGKNQPPFPTGETRLVEKPIPALPTLAVRLWQKEDQNWADFHPLVKRAKTAFLKGSYQKADEALQRFQTCHPHAADDPVFCFLRGTTLAWNGQSARSLAIFARHPSLWSLSSPLRAAAHLRNADYDIALDLLQKKFTDLRQMPQSIQAHLLMAAAQSALYVGSPTKAKLFLGALSKLNLTPYQAAALRTMKSYAEDNASVAFPPLNVEELSKPSDWQAYHRAVQAKLRHILVQHQVEKISDDQAIGRLRMLAQEGRGGESEFETLRALAHMCIKAKRPYQALQAFGRIMKHAPPDYAPRKNLWQEASDLYVKTLYEKSMLPLKKCALFKTYHMFLPKDQSGVEVIKTMTPLFIDMQLLDHLIPLIVPAFKRNPTEFTRILLLCVRHYIQDGNGLEALRVLNGLHPPKAFYQFWKQHKAYALASIGEAEKALELLKVPPETEQSARVILPAYLALGKKKEATKMMDIIVRATKDPKDLDRLATLLYHANNLAYLKDFLAETNIQPSAYTKTLMAHHDLAEEAHPNLASPRFLEKLTRFKTNARAAFLEQ